MRNDAGFMDENYEKLVNFLRGGFSSYFGGSKLLERFKILKSGSLIPDLYILGLQMLICRFSVFIWIFPDS